MNQRIAIKIMLGLLLSVVIFHVCIIIKIIPYEITWGGKLKSDQEMYAFESFSIIVNLLLGFVLLMKGGFLKRYFRDRAINIILWIFLILFSLNTIGNIFAKTNFEKSFAALTLVSAILLVMILKNKINNNSR